ncbi:MFS transporter [Granulicella sp. WH15]|uniref:MFS transporter n=1 Tax=Granulicella sp. WH15 TaxID=2602070 RepID=UPI0013674828|nr:MFS transporter [Granulicella sp. WH15]QHN03820.1 MFS transporter [Granulicella sp. WH15]
MSTNTGGLSQDSGSPHEGFASSEPATGHNIRWFVCGLLFLATTINYMDRSVLSLIEPMLHNLPFMGWDFSQDNAHQSVFNNNYGNIIICFQIAYGVGLLTAGRIIDKLGTKLGYALAIGIWALSSMSHAFVFSVAGFCIARFMLGLGEAGNFPAAIKATTEWFPSEERALATGLFNSGSNASAFIAPPLVAFVTYKYGWHAAFITTGSMGLIWLVIWLFFPYNRLRRGATQTQINLQQAIPGTANAGFFTLFRELSKQPGLYAFAIGKAFTDPVWWFYLFYLPKFLNENYGLDLNHAKYPIIIVYAFSSVGSIGGGWLSGLRMKQGHSVNDGRKFAMLICAICVLPIMLVPMAGHIFHGNVWPAIALFSLATAAHQGWSANLFSTPTDMFPSTSVSTVVGIGGAAGAVGGAIFTYVVKTQFSAHPLLIFLLGGFSYISALALFQILVPRIGESRSKA